MSMNTQDNDWASLCDWEPTKQSKFTPHFRAVSNRVLKGVPWPTQIHNHHAMEGPARHQ